MTARPIALFLEGRRAGNRPGAPSAPAAPDAGAASASDPSVTDAAAAAERAAGRRRSNRLQELDAFRALMVLVVSFHAYQASTGDLDVHALRDLSVGGVLLGNVDVLLPTFFVLSGFAIYYQFAALVLSGRELPGSRLWLFKRGLRLLPVYFLVFVVVWVWRYGGGTEQWEDLGWGLLLMQTWSTDHIFRTIDPGWYLSIEWQFAVVTAVVIMPWLRLITKWPQRSRFAGLLVPPAVLSLITIWWRTSLENEGIPGDRWGAWFAPPSWGMMYAAGMLLGLALVLRPPHLWRLPAPASLLIFAGSTAGLIYLQLLRGADRFATVWYFHLAIIGVTGWLISAIVADPEGRTRRMLRSRFVQALAAASFVTYIVHAPVLRSLAARNILPMNDPSMWWASAAAIVIISLALGYVVHRYLEGPLTSLEKLLAPKVTRVARVVTVTEPTIAPGDRLPALPVVDDLGERHDLRDLAGGRPMLLLIYPTGLVPRHSAMQGAGGAVRTLDGVRAAAAGMDVGLATLSPGVPRHVDRDDHLPPVTRLVDPDSAVARAMGVAVARTADGRRLPEVLMLVVNGGGYVSATIRERDAHLMLHRALAAIDAASGSPGRFQRRKVSRPARSAPSPAPVADEA